MGTEHTGQGCGPTSQPSHGSQPSRRRSIVLLSICATLLVLQVAVLKALPYTTVSISDVSREEIQAQRQQSPLDGFGIGAVRWDVPALARDPSLEPFRRYFQAACPDKRGLAAALCLSDSFAQQFPFGDQSDDFFSPDYDPVAALRAHVERGEPGHCVSRSGLAATALLSAGIPACVVSLVSLEGSGHSVLSVWDEQYGWVTVDPSTGRVFWNDDGPTSAFRALDKLTTFQAHQLAREPNGADALRLNYAEGDSGLLRGHLLYPEPWLYLRTGRHAAQWPFRAILLHVGPWQWRMGPAQNALHVGIILCLVWLVLMSSLLGRRAALRRLRRTSVQS